MFRSFLKASEVLEDDTVLLLDIIRFWLGVISGSGAGEKRVG